MKKENKGSSLDDWLREEGIYEQVTAAAVQRVLARVLAQHETVEPIRFLVTLTPDGKFFVVTFCDIPEAITQGEGLDEAMMMASDALETALDFYFEGGREIPISAPRPLGWPFVQLCDDLAEKVLAHNRAVLSKTSECGPV